MQHVSVCHCLSCKNYGVEGQPRRSPHGSSRWDRAHLSLASRVCFVLLFPVSDNVAHIMGSCTALRWDRKLIQMHRREWPNYLATHQIQRTAHQKTPPPEWLLGHFIGCPQKLNFLWQIRALCEVSCCSLLGTKPSFSIGLCRSACCSVCLTIPAHILTTIHNAMVTWIWSLHGSLFEIC